MIALDGQETDEDIIDFFSTNGKHSYNLHLTSSEVDGKKKTYLLDSGGTLVSSFRLYQEYIAISMNGQAKDFGDAKGLLGGHAMPMEVW